MKAPKGPRLATHRAETPIDSAHPSDTVSESPLKRATPNRCTAHKSTTGERCRNHAVAGARVCRYHGGAAPQVKRKALERLQDYQDRAIDALFELAEDKAFPSTRYQAVRDVLDRTMGKPSEAVTVQHAGALEVRWMTPETAAIEASVTVIAERSEDESDQP